MGRGRAAEGLRSGLRSGMPSGQRGARALAVTAGEARPSGQALALAGGLPLARLHFHFFSLMYSCMHSGSAEKVADILTQN